MAVIARCDVCGREVVLQKKWYSSYYEPPAGWFTEEIKPKGVRGLFGAESAFEHYCSDICRVAGIGNHALNKS